MTTPRPSVRMLNSLWGWVEDVLTREAPYVITPDRRLHLASSGCPKLATDGHGKQGVDARVAAIVLDNKDAVACGCLISALTPPAAPKPEVTGGLKKLRGWLEDPLAIFLVNRRELDQVDIVVVKTEGREWREVDFLGRFTQAEAVELVGQLAVYRSSLSVREAGFALEPGFENFLRERVTPAEWRFDWTRHRDQLTVYVA